MMSFVNYLNIKVFASVYFTDGVQLFIIIVMSFLSG